ncbi:hypothetical protein B0I08_11036 [Glaciihabitans tibetensis]|uniref:Uncharacterized protein n=1 Tax=Glaciihabitans tibetensis TaxID=1266600 RepID=A0A2T0V5H3_9MICO|nr:hypothetical protein [Glaciihabitans tibetensis]PRY65404.1 hypothetical protein B0I08_11036 [Glaciihabitans tibetensis]
MDQKNETAAGFKSLAGTRKRQAAEAFVENLENGDLFGSLMADYDENYDRDIRHYISRRDELEVRLCVAEGRAFVPKSKRREIPSQ